MIKDFNVSRFNPKQDTLLISSEHFLEPEEIEWLIKAVSPITNKYLVISGGKITVIRSSKRKIHFIK